MTDIVFCRLVNKMIELPCREMLEVSYSLSTRVCEQWYLVLIAAAYAEEIVQDEQLLRAVRTVKTNVRPYGVDHVYAPFPLDEKVRLICYTIR